LDRHHGQYDKWHQRVGEECDYTIVGTPWRIQQPAAHKNDWRCEAKANSPQEKPFCRLILRQRAFNNSSQQQENYIEKKGTLKISSYYLVTVTVRHENSKHRGY